MLVGGHLLMKKLVIVTEYGLMWEGIRLTLAEALGNEIHIQVITKQNAPLSGGTIDADLLLLDVGANDDQLSYWLKNFESKDIKIIVWLVEIHKQLLLKLFRQKLNGYFFGEMEMNDLLTALRTILKGKQYIHPELSAILLEEYIYLTKGGKDRPIGILTKQEWKVLEEISRGKSNQDIAKDLYISSYTVNNHVSSILKKLHVSDRTKAALLAVQNKWVELH